MVSLDKDAQEYLALRRRTSGMSQTLTPLSLRDEERRLRERYGHGPQMFRERLVSAAEGCPRHFVLDPVAQPQGTVLYLHGGGWVMGEPEDYLAVCRSLAKSSGWRVLVADYAKAPERPFPNGLDECLRLARSLVQARKTSPSDASSALNRIVLAGDSAGGNLAAAITAQLSETYPGSIAAQVLITPVLDADFERPSYLDPERQLSLTRAHMQWFFDQYVPSAADRADPRISPLRAESFAGLPRTFVVSAGSDVLKSEIDEYLAKITEAGVLVRHLELAGQMHGFFQLHNVMAASERAVDWVAAALHTLEVPGSGRHTKGTSR